MIRDEVSNDFRQERRIWCIDGIQILQHNEYYSGEREFMLSVLLYLAKWY